MGRVLRRAAYVKLGIVFVAFVLGSVAFLRLAAGPVSLRDYAKDVGDTLAGRIGPGWSVVLNDADLAIEGFRPTLRTAGLDIRNPDGVLVVRAPSASVTLDPLSLLSARVTPRAIDLRDLQLRASIARDGTISVVPTGEGGPPAPVVEAPPAGPATAAGDEVSTVSAAVASILANLVDPSSFIGGLDAASVTGAKLSLIDADGRERVAFDRVGARFVRGPERTRSIDVDLTGARGAWKLAGEVRDGEGGRTADLRATDVPLADVLLLGGLSSVGDGVDLKLSGEVSAALDGRRLRNLTGRFASAPGSLRLPGLDPVPVDRLGGEVAWDEAGIAFGLKHIVLRSGASEIGLSGRVSLVGEGSTRAYRLALDGGGSVLEGLSPADGQIAIGEIAASAVIRDGGAVLDRLVLKGPGLDVKLAGAIETTPDGPTLKGDLLVQDSEVRRVLRLWPANVNRELRSFLVDDLHGGTLKRLDLTTTLDAVDFRAAMASQPVSDQAVKTEFALTNATMSVADGLPQLRRLSVDGSATGMMSRLTARRARIELADGRSLNFTEGSFRQSDFETLDKLAHISFRLDGGADAVASLLRTPVFREVNAIDLDPASVRGRADIRVSLPLRLKLLPKPADLPITITGTLGDLSIDKAFGREKLESANLSLSYQNGAATIRGEGRVGGSPAILELKQPRGGVGEIGITLTLDEAARARRSLPVAPALVGPIAVKIAATLGGKGKAAPRVEADLTRAAIDNLLPGWTKPAGRPGKLAFVLGEAEAGTFRDIVLEAGPVQVRGQASFGADGVLDKADLSTLKLSPGDDMRAQVERAAGAYRVVLRGNVGDVRPVLKSATGPSAAAAGPNGKPATAGSDIELDVQLAIATGFNDEALTNVQAKASLRNRELRGLQFSGRFKAAAVDATIARGDSGAPALNLRTTDAGAALRFLDLYRRMVGGTLALETSVGGAAQTGKVSIDDFVLKGEPALKSITSGQPVEARSEDRRDVTRIDTDLVQFSKLVADFRRSATRADFKDVAIWGPQVGFTLSGFLDYGRDRTDISGTFIPAFGLNNVFSQVPIVGLILGGGYNEGLFAVEFRVSGPASGPTLTVNPLSAVAPGILRKFFFWAMPGDDTPTATDPPPASARGASPSSQRGGR